MRLIDGIALEERCNRQISSEWNKLATPSSWADAYEQFLTDVENCTTIDAVPVVRCRECIYWHENGEESYCSNLSIDVDADFFCSCGRDKRREDEPEINPCRGCSDYDGNGRCLSDGG